MVLYMFPESERVNFEPPFKQVRKESSLLVLEQEMCLWKGGHRPLPKLGGRRSSGLEVPESAGRGGAWDAIGVEPLPKQLAP